MDDRKPPPLPIHGTWSVTSGTDYRVGAQHRSAEGALLVVFAIFWHTMLAALAAGLIHAAGAVPLCVLAPQALGTVFIDAYILLGLFGQTEVRINNDACEVFTGIGQLGWRQTFWRHEVHLVSHCITRGRHNKEVCSILIQADRDIVFGRLLDHERRAWMLRTLTHALLPIGTR
ncbi:MAG: hypothetical protein QM783_20195 [Phycisphaerales bacterium]